jgi:tripartite-type tricarboxylate transporter receptor subunit TctC
MDGRTFSASLSVALTGACFASTVLAQADYPVRPVRIVVAQAAGSGVDSMARLIGQRLGEVMGQQFIVDNRPGANGIIGMEQAAKSKPDGYTLILAVVSAVATNPYVYKKLPYDPFRDFSAVTLTAVNTFGLTVNASLPVRSVKELIALGRANRGELTYGSFGVGNLTHLGGELFAAETHLKMVHVPYKGETPAITDLIGGQIAMMINPMQGSTPHVRAGKLRLLATCSEERAGAFPDVPTLKESGFPSVVIAGWTGLLVPAGTPREIIGRLASETTRYLLLPEQKQRLTALGAEPVQSSPEHFSAFMKTEAERWSKVIRLAGLEHSQ